jgi:hypothetical protein
MPAGGLLDADASVGRIFQDAAGRHWRVTLSGADGEAVLEFTCIGESREPARVKAVARSFTFTGITDESLRGWLVSAPRVGRLNE